MDAGTAVKITQQGKGSAIASGSDLFDGGKACLDIAFSAFAKHTHFPDAKPGGGAAGLGSLTIVVECL
ncbi:hypothetical protein GCM10010837_14550 [Aminobacter niigataensis]